MEGLKGNVSSDFWRDKKVFITGHTGFKGSWLSIWLQSMGANLKGYALEPPTNPSLFQQANVDSNMVSEIGNINDLLSLKKSMKDFNPEILIHMAAQPLVRFSYKEPIETYKTNVIGTANVLESARSCPNLKAIVSVTTDKCYENKEWEWGYRENEPMGGNDPYSSSKGCAELVTAAYRNSFFSTNNTPNLASARAGNVIGGGDFSKDRIVPDYFRALLKNQKLTLRSPHSIRPWQHVLDPLFGYVLLLMRLYKKQIATGSSFNFGPIHENNKTVLNTINLLNSNFNNSVKIVKKNNNLNKFTESKILMLNSDKSKKILKWNNKYDLPQSMKLTSFWFKEFIQNKNILKITQDQIKNYLD